MKRLSLFAPGVAGLFAVAGLSAMAGLFAADRPIHAVYILPMAGGLDQYLAERIAQDRTFVVVANPKSADAVLTDRLGQGFEQQMDRIDGKKDDNSRPMFHSNLGQGTIFLVDAHSRQVLWSDYEKPGGKPAREAERIAKKLQTFNR
jgi:hypothetical protein